MTAGHRDGVPPMRLLDLGPVDEQLRERAAALLDRRFTPLRHHVAAALLTDAGHVVTGVHLGSRRVNVCAEQIALGTALSAGLGMPVACVSVIRMAADEPATVTSPCGVCRELLGYYNPDMTTLIALPTGIAKTVMADLLPAPWMLPAELR